MNEVIERPSHKDCSVNKLVYHQNGAMGYAAWFPQMGNLVACVIVIRKNLKCFDVLLWHNGYFPECFHFCAAEHFIKFGQDIMKMQENAGCWDASNQKQGAL